MIRKSPSPDIVTSEQGFILVMAIVLLLILTIVGITAMTISVTERQIANNDKLQKQSFSQADGGTEAGGNLLEENISCPDGFSADVPSVPASKQIGGAQVTENIPTGVTGAKLNFWKNETDPALLAIPVPYPSDTQRHIRIPNNDAAPHTNLHFFGNSELSTGNAIQMLAGYEGTGYSTATGGGQLVTNIDSQHIGENNSESSVRVLWRHVIGHEGTCNY